MNDSRDDDDHDRLVRLERDFTHVSNTVDKTARDVEEIKKFIQRAGGARVAIVAVFTVIGIGVGWLFQWTGVHK